MILNANFKDFGLKKKHIWYGKIQNTHLMLKFPSPTLKNILCWFSINWIYQPKSEYKAYLYYLYICFYLSICPFSVLKYVYLFTYPIVYLSIYLGWKTWYSCAVTAPAKCAGIEWVNVLSVENQLKEGYYCISQSGWLSKEPVLCSSCHNREAF